MEEEKRRRGGIGRGKAVLLLSLGSHSTPSSSFISQWFVFKLRIHVQDRCIQPDAKIKIMILVIKG
jgi:hypothetical protein